VGIRAAAVAGGIDFSRLDRGGALPDIDVLHIDVDRFLPGVASLTGSRHADAVRGICLIVILEVEVEAGADLLQVAQAGALAGLVARLGENREEDGCQDGDNSDHHEQLDQGKCEQTTSSHIRSFRSVVADRVACRTAKNPLRAVTATKTPGGV
jgi:hypothetical protein